MGHSFVRIFVHLVWSTKNWRHFITSGLRPQLFQHFREYFKLNKIHFDSIGIQPGQVHLLVGVRSDQKIDDIVKLIKGESSHWINSDNLIHSKFSWQEGYGAFSVSSHNLDGIRDYIRNQDEHHRKRSFREELEAILVQHQFNISDLTAEEGNQ